MVKSLLSRGTVKYLRVLNVRTTRGTLDTGRLAFGKKKVAFEKRQLKNRQYLLWPLIHRGKHTRPNRIRRTAFLQKVTEGAKRWCIPRAALKTRVARKPAFNHAWRRWARIPPSSSSSATVRRGDRDAFEVHRLPVVGQDVQLPSPSTLTCKRASRRSAWFGLTPNPPTRSNSTR
jgi:hypothetical protein